jgi:hypothetical protein
MIGDTKGQAGRPGRPLAASRTCCRLEVSSVSVATTAVVYRCVCCLSCLRTRRSGTRCCSTACTGSPHRLELPVKFTATRSTPSSTHAHPGEGISHPDIRDESRLLCHRAVFSSCLLLVRCTGSSSVLCFKSLLGYQERHVCDSMTHCNACCCCCGWWCCCCCCCCPSCPPVGHVRCASMSATWA